MSSTDCMLETTYTKHAPWSPVDFNEQRRGRLMLISDPLECIPDRRVPLQTVKFPPLGHQPLREKFRGPLRPIPGF